MSKAIHEFNPRAVHVLPWPAHARGRCHGWKVTHAGEHQIGAERKRDAVRFATDLAKSLRTELIVHNRNGRIAWRNSYGNDPRSRKG